MPKVSKTPDELADAIFGKDDQKEEKPKKHFVAVEKPSLVELSKEIEELGGLM